MPGRFKYEKLPKYPHLSEADAILWERFIDAYPTFFDHVDYDVHVGKGLEPDPSWEPNIVFMAIYLTQSRIDVIGYNLDLSTIVELKPRARTTAVGQLMTYQALYRSTNPYLPSPDLLLITDDLNTDIKSVCQKLNISYIII